MPPEEGREEPAGKRPRGRPRSQACHQATLDATLALLEEGGYGAVTMEGIAARAGVAKQTLYKWWPSKARLATEAYACRAAAQIPAPDTGRAEDDLRALLWHTCGALSRDNMGAILSGLIAEAQSDPELGVELRETFIAARRRVSAGILARGIERGELRRDLDVQLVIDLLFGPIRYRLLVRNGPLDEPFAGAIVAHLLPGLRVDPGASIAGHGAGRT